MIPYLVVFLLLVLLSFRYDINEKTKYGEFGYYLALTGIVLLAGLRYRLGVDTTAYMYGFYHLVPVLPDFFKDEDYMSEPGFYLLCSLVKTLGGKFYIVQLLHAAFVCGLLFRFFKNHSKYVFTCILLFYIWDFTSCLMETMRASMAVVICLYGNEFFIKKKLLKGFSLYAIAFLFHNSSVLLLITPLLLFLRLKFNMMGLLVIFFAVIIGKVIQDQLEDLFLLFNLDTNFSDKAIGYVNDDHYASNVKHNIFYYIVNIGSYLFYLFISFFIIKRNRNGDLLNLQPFIIIGLMFISLKDNSSIFYRYVEFFIPYFILYFVELFIGGVKSFPNLGRGVCVLRTFILFIPLFYIIMGRYNTGIVRYYPYSSVIERSISVERETDYKKLRTDFSLILNENEY